MAFPEGHAPSTPHRLVVHEDTLRADRYEASADSELGKPLHRPYAMRHTYAAWALAAGVNVYTLARRMGTSLKMIDETYGHFAQDAEDYERDLHDAYDRAARRGRLGG